MSFEGMLSQTATITLRTRTGARDSTNIPTLSDSAPATEPCYVEQTDRREIEVGRETLIATHLGVFGPASIVDASALVVVAGQTFEVLGPPWSVDRPGHGVHHLEATMREVT